MGTIQAADVDGFGSPDGVAAAGADILPGGAGLAPGGWRGWSVRAGSCDLVAAVFVAVDENVGQIVVQAELQQMVAGACDRPAVFVMMFHKETMCDGAVPESSVVVCPSSAAILNAINVIVVMYHLMQQCGADVFNGSCQGSGAQINFVGRAVLADPGIISEREMPIGLGCGLDGDRWP